MPAANMDLLPGLDRPLNRRYPLTVISWQDNIWPVIKTFKCKETEALFYGRLSRKLPQDIQREAAIKLNMLHAATLLKTLHVPPSNHLEALRGDRKGQHSIRINDQWRVCFVWRNNNAFEVEIVDYH